MNFELFIAKKHLTHGRRTGFISLSSAISVAGVSIGVFALIVVLAVMSGFDRELQSKIVNVQPHLRIEKFGGVDDAAADIEKIKLHHIPQIQSIARFVEGQAIIRSGDDATGVLVKGIDAANEDVTIFDEHMIAGGIDFKDNVTTETRRRFFFFKRTIEKRTGALFLGEVLADRLRVRVGEPVSLIVPFQDSSKPFSLLNTSSRTFMVKGIFRIGMNDFDASLVLISLPQTQEMYHLDQRVTGIGIRLRDVEAAEKWKWRLRADFPVEYSIRSWYDMNHNFFRALKVEKSVMTILLALIILVAAFNIVSTLTMVVMEKTRDIGILRAIGATRASVHRIFMIEGVSIGFLGVILGTILGLAAAHHLNPISDFIKRTTGLEVFPSDIYYFDRIPSEIHPPDVALIVLFAFLASVFAGLYPAHRAARLSPVEALRYE